MRLFSLVAAALVLTNPQGAIAKERLTLEPSSPWNLDYASEACRLGRSFGEGDQKVLLILAKYAPGLTMEILASGELLAADRARSFSYSFDPNERVEIDRPLFGELPNGGTIWQFIAGLIPPEDFAQLADSEALPAQIKAAELTSAGKVESLTLRIGRRPEIALQTGGLAAGLGAMDQCLDNLVKSWGYDPGKLASVVSGPQPIGRVERWLNQNDYPTEALRKDLSGAVRFRLGISETGHITNCTIQSSYSDPSFPDKVCSEFRRKAEFEPARNADGEGVASYWASTVVFLSKP